MGKTSAKNGTEGYKVHIEVTTKSVDKFMWAMGDTGSETENGGLYLLGKTYAGGNTRGQNREKDGSELPFRGGVCAVCTMQTAIGDSDVLRFYESGSSTPICIAHEHCLTKSLFGSYGLKMQQFAVKFLGKTPFEQRLRVVQQVFKLLRRTTPAIFH